MRLFFFILFANYHNTHFFLIEVKNKNQSNAPSFLCKRNQNKLCAFRKRKRKKHTKSKQKKAKNKKKIIHSVKILSS